MVLQGSPAHTSPVVVDEPLIAATVFTEFRPGRTAERGQYNNFDDVDGITRSGEKYRIAQSG
jgi:hypothetical protein